MEWCVASHTQIEVLSIQQIDGHEVPIGPHHEAGIMNDMEDAEENLAASQLLNAADPTLLPWREIKEGWGSCRNFYLSYGLKPWNADAWHEAVAISRAMRAHSTNKPAAKIGVAILKPDILQKHVFGKLGISLLALARRACQQWSSAVGGMTTLALQFGVDEFEEDEEDSVLDFRGVMRYVVHVFPNLSQLSISIGQAELIDGCGGFMEPVFWTSFFRNCPPLETLEVHFPSCCTEGVLQLMTAECVEVIGRHPLKALYISNLSIHGRDAAHLLSCYPNLTALNLSHIDIIGSFNSLDPVIEAITQLQSLHILGLSAWTFMPSGYEYRGSPYDKSLRDDDVILLVEHLPQLRCLEIDGLPGGGYISDESLYAIASSCPNLQLLDISFNEDCTFSGVQDVVQSCPLRELRIADTGVEHKKLKAICDSCPTLRLLQFSEGSMHQKQYEKALYAAMGAYSGIVFVSDMSGAIDPEGATAYMKKKQIRKSQASLAAFSRALHNAALECIHSGIPEWADNEWERPCLKN